MGNRFVKWGHTDMTCVNVYIYILILHIDTYQIQTVYAFVYMHVHTHMCSHTLAQKQHCEFCCGVHHTCTKQSLKNCQEKLVDPA